MKRFLAIYVGTKAALERAKWGTEHAAAIVDVPCFARETPVAALGGGSVEIMECLPLPGR